MYSLVEFGQVLMYECIFKYLDREYVCSVAIKSICCCVALFESCLVLYAFIASSFVLSIYIQQQHFIKYHVKKFTQLQLRVSHSVEEVQI